MVDKRINLTDKFIVPPFSILDTKQAYWQKRKRYWLNKGIKSEIGREENLLGFSDTVRRQMGNEEGMGGSSIFDPVLCEIMYKWFAPKGGRILDPFAGGSVRGIVAAELDFKYTGLELSRSQVIANCDQAHKMGLPMMWRAGDSEKLVDDLENDTYDMIFSCPPYYDLEVYSKDENDLSNMSYKDFLEKYSRIIKKSLDKLKNNRFAVFVVGDIRDKRGNYRCFVENTIKIFLSHNTHKYNDIILVNAIGTLPIRITNQFKNKRKVGKMHQNIIVFLKGNVDLMVHDLGECNYYVNDQVELTKF